MNYFKKLLLLITVFVLATVSAAPQAIHLKQGNRFITLFGTMHIAKPSFYPLPKAVLEALKKADALAVELDMTDEEIKNQTMQLMMASAMSKNTQPLTEKQKQQVKAVLGTAPALAGEPWFLAIAISLHRAEKLGFTEVGIDETLINMAKMKGKPVISLETPSEQIDVFRSIPHSEAIQLFDNAVSDHFADELRMTEALWENCDHQITETLHKAMQTETPILYKMINSDRNQKIAERIIRQTEHTPNLFIAIGAMHVCGETSVTEHLIQHGFEKVE